MTVRTFQLSCKGIGSAAALILGACVLTLTDSAGAGEIEYTYDAAGRLVAAEADNNLVSTYSYDANGNLLNRTTAMATDADVQLTKSSDFSAITIGFDLNFTLAVSNAGPDAATGVTVSDPLPFGLVFSFGSASQGGFSFASNTVFGDLGVLPAGAAAAVNFAALPAITNLMTNTAVAAASQSDPDLGNNTSSTVSRGLEPIFDSDGDGMPNWWEQSNGLNAFSSNGVAGASGDLDLDGVSNFDEWIADTRADDPGSIFVIDSIIHPSGNPGTVSLHFKSSPIRYYEGQVTDSLGPTSFDGFTTNQGTGRTLSMTHTNGSPTNQFYRVEVRAP